MPKRVRGQLATLSTAVFDPIRAQALLKRARQEGTPLIDGNTATFVWQGDHAPLLLSDYNGWRSDPAGVHMLTQLDSTIWVSNLELRPDTYLEYVYLDPRERNAKGQMKRVRDPFNKRIVMMRGIGEKDAFNHFFTMPKFQPSPYVTKQSARQVPPGQVSSFTLRSMLVAGMARKVHLYQPATAGPYSLLLVYDGQDYLRRGKLTTILDNLIAAKRIPPLALAMVEHGGAARVPEYALSESTLGFIDSAVLPLARSELDLIDPSISPYGVLGASMSGLMSLYTGLRLPHLFGRVFSQSGAFSTGLFGFENPIFDMVRHMSPPPIRVWLDCGYYEWLRRSNDAMASLLNAKGYTVHYHCYSGGHNYPSWSFDLADGLTYLWS